MHSELGQSSRPRATSDVLAPRAQHDGLLVCLGSESSLKMLARRLALSLYELLVVVAE